MHELSLVAILGLVVYRVTRFLVADTLIEGTRIKLGDRVLGDPYKSVVWREKLYELMYCPYCLSIWVSAAAVAAADHWVSVPLPGFTWLAVAGAAMVFWRFVEHPPETVEIKPAEDKE